MGPLQQQTAARHRRGQKNRQSPRPRPRRQRSRCRHHLPRLRRPKPNAPSPNSAPTASRPSLPLRSPLSREHPPHRQAVATDFGRLDLLVNNAGLFETAALEAITVPQWDAMFETNTRAPFLTSQAALPIPQSRPRPHHQHRLPRRNPPLAHPRPLLHLQSRPPHAHRHHVQSLRPRNQRQLRRPRHDRRQRQAPAATSETAAEYEHFAQEPPCAATEPPRTSPKPSSSSPPAPTSSPDKS